MSHVASIFTQLWGDNAIDVPSNPNFGGGGGGRAPCPWWIDAREARCSLLRLVRDD